MELEHAVGFSGTVRCGSLHVHPNEEKIVHAQGASVVISSLRDAHDQLFLRGHDDLVSCLTLSKSGQLIISGQQGVNSDVIVWKYETRQEYYRLQEHDGGVLIAVLTDDERFLLTVGLDKKMVVWDMESGCVVARQTGTVHCACACWGGRKRNVKNRETLDYQFATGGDANLTYWHLDPREGKLVAEQCSLGNQIRNFTALVFSSDTEYLFAGSSSSDFTAVHVKHKVMHSTTTCGSGGVRAMIAMCKSPYGDRIIIGCGDGSIGVFEGTRNGAKTCRTYSGGPTSACTVFIDGAVSALQLRHANEASGELRLLAGTEKGTIYAVSLCAADHRAQHAPEAITSVLSESHFGPVTAVAYPPGSSDYFATASTDGMLRVWDLNTYEVVAKGGCQSTIAGDPLCLVFTGEVLMSGWTDGKIRAHDAESGEQLWVIDNAHRNGVTSLASSHNKKFMVSGGEEGEVRVWEVRTREMIVHLKQHTMQVSSLVLFDDDSHVVSASRDRTIYLWDLQSETRKASLTQRMGGINAIALLPDHVQLVSVGQERSVAYWDLREPAPLAQLPAGHEQYAVAQFTPASANGNSDATIFASAGVDCIVRIWNFKSGSVVATGVGHSAPVRSLQFSPDGKQLVSVGEDAAVLIWNIFVEDLVPTL